MFHRRRDSDTARNFPCYLTIVSLRHRPARGARCQRCAYQNAPRRCSQAGLGIRALGWTAMQPDDLVPAALSAGLLASPPRGSYSEEQIVQLRLYVVAQRQSSELLRLFDLILASGLRHDEAARLWESDLTRQDGFVRVRGTNAKGGPDPTVGPNLDLQG